MVSGHTACPGVERCESNDTLSSTRWTSPLHPSRSGRRSRKSTSHPSVIRCISPSWGSQSRCAPKSFDRMSAGRGPRSSPTSCAFPRKSQNGSRPNATHLRSSRIRDFEWHIVWTCLMVRSAWSPGPTDLIEPRSERVCSFPASMSFAECLARAFACQYGLFSTAFRRISCGAFKPIPSVVLAIRNRILACHEDLVPSRLAHLVRRCSTPCTTMSADLNGTRC
jgi:hypothetical protein